MNNDNRNNNNNTFNWVGEVILTSQGVIPLPCRAG